MESHSFAGDVDVMACSLQRASNAAAMYRANGFFMMPGLLSRRQVRELSERMHAYTHERGPLLRQNIEGSGYGASRGGWRRLPV